MSRQKKIAIIATIVVLILLMAMFPFIKRSLAPADGRPVKPVSEKAGGGGRSLHVNATVMQYESLGNSLNTIGILMADEEVDLSFEISGMITSIVFREGSKVRKGQLLARINDKPLQAELKKLQAQLPLAEARVYRQQQLLDKEAVSQESYESVATDLEKLKADIELVRSRIAQTELRAPFDGEIGLRQVSEGSYASPTVVVARLTKIQPLKLEFSVNEKQAFYLRTGKQVEFTVENVKHQATIYALESKIDRATQSLKARALYPNANGALKPGMSASINMHLLDTDKALLVPSIALTADIGRDFVYVYRSGVARQQSVKKGMRTASSIEITEGLMPGDTIITSGVMQLRDGMTVTINELQGPN